jgi:HEAT repeat protein
MRPGIEVAEHPGMRKAIFLLLLVLPQGCAPETLYNRKPLRYWKQELKNHDSTARYKAAVTFSEVGQKARMAIPELIECLHDSEPHVVVYAAIALGNVGPEVSEAVPELVKLLKHPAPYVREAAEQALKKIDPEAAAQAGVK